MPGLGSVTAIAARHVGSVGEEGVGSWARGAA